MRLRLQRALYGQVVPDPIAQFLQPCGWVRVILSYIRNRFIVISPRRVLEII